MTPTRKRLLALIAALGLLCGVTVSRAYLAASTMLLDVRSSTPIILAVMCLALLWWTILIRRRLTHIARAAHEARNDGTPFVMREKPLDPMVAARTVALAFAASRAGSYVCGFYAGVAITFISRLDVDDVRWRLGYAALSALLAFLLVVIALWLERSCKLPKPPVPRGIDPVLP